ncbi:MAG: hypothetical protein JXR37_00975 [Kiritimatiellae bacterium]|nr:hypothetical protein [Kiritimatiellia bacterium]
MSIRALLIGFALALFIALGGHFNDAYMQQTFIVGNFFPIFVVGILVVVVLVVNPLLCRVRRNWRLSSAELAVVVALPFAACVVPSSGFLRTFTSALVMPAHYEKSDFSWQKNEVLSYVPDGLLVRPGPENEDVVLGGFLRGMAKEGEHISLARVPWRAWLPALLRWVPLFAVLMIGLTGLALVFHRQWSTHEHLVYPVAEFVRLLFGEEGQQPAPVITRTRLFWYGLLAVFGIHVINGLHAWFPAFIQFPTEIDLSPLRELMPGLASAPMSGGLFQASVFFSVVAFAYFLPSDITLSLGLTNLVAAAFGATLITYGVKMTSSYMGVGEIQGLLFGAYLAVFVMILVTGRAYYRRTLLSAVGLRPGGDVDRSAVWGLRVFLAMALVGTLMMVGLGLPWPFAVVVVLLVTLMFAAMSRICAETGLFFIQPYWQATAVLLGLAGAHALGPRIMAVLAMACVVLTIDPREAMMPFVANALRVAENHGVPRGRVAAAMGLTFLLCLVGGLVTVLWLQYDRGAWLGDSWATQNVPKMGFELVDQQIQTMQADGVLAESVGMTLGHRILAVRPDKRFVTWLLVGFGLFVSFAFLRIRFAKWPFHPIIFLVWMTYPIAKIGTSFLIGWAVKALVVRLGGGRTYRNVRPFMVGMIAGDLLGGLLWMIVGALYYAVKGFPPVKFSIFPG